MMNTMTESDSIDILARLDAMRVQEETLCVKNYFSNISTTIDASARSAMVTWIQQVQRTLSLSPETVWISMSYFDRYLSSGRGISHKVLMSPRMFQLAAITCFYTAVKINEPVVLPVDMLLQICRGTYSEQDILDMESDILVALGWRVSTFSPMDFVRELMGLISVEQQEVVDSLLSSCQEHLDYAMTDIGFSTMKPSDVGISCLASSFVISDLISVSEKQSLWMKLSEVTQFDLCSQDVLVAQECLLSNSSCSSSSSNILLCKSCSHDDSTLLAKPVSACITVDRVISSSPVCVSQTARQA